MNIVSLSCASCGAPIQVPPDIDQFTCSHCGTTLVVQRGEGYVALKVAEHLSKAISETGQQTREAISEGTNVTQVELKRLQITQDLSAAQMQLSSVQAEIRSLERQKKNRLIKDQLKQLQSEEMYLIERIRGLRSAISTIARPTKAEFSSQGSVSKPSMNGEYDAAYLPPRPSKTPFFKTANGRGCLSGCLVYFLVTMACTAVSIPLDKAIFNIDSTQTGTGPGLFGSIGMFFAMFCGLVFFFYKRNPDAGIWKSIKAKLPFKKQNPVQ